jgi:DNA-binding CsgD family transcriptional regulator
MKEEALLDSAATIRTVEDFKAWTKQHVRPVLPHGALVSGLGHLHAGGVSLDYLVAVDYPIEQIEANRNRAGAIETPILRRWLTEQRPVYFDGGNPWPGMQGVWLDSFERYQLRNVLAHAVLDVDRCFGTYHSFFRLPGTPSEQQMETLHRVVPVLHQVLRQLIERVNSTDDFAVRIARMTEREREVLRWLRLGKTNAEIAELTGLSESTVKHYLTRLFDELGVSNRAQLVRFFTERMPQQEPGYNTKVL